MDKNEYRAKLDEINDLVDRQDYKGALKIVDTIDWRRVRSARTLCMVGEIYEANKRYEDSRKLLLMAHHRAPIGRTVIYRLVELSIKMGNFDEAADYYKQFVEISQWEILMKPLIIINSLWKFLLTTTAVIF